MGEVTLKDLLDAGVHFGHQTKRWNPKMKPYIFMEKNGIHILDLRQTLAAAGRACETVRALAAEGKLILLLGTKAQAKLVVREQSSDGSEAR
jgi:small subunit ribosomal protein S2